jgi:hypothetical protein
MQPKRTLFFQTRKEKEKRFQTRKSTAMKSRDYVLTGIPRQGEEKSLGENAYIYRDLSCVFILKSLSEIPKGCFRGSLVLVMKRSKIVTEVSVSWGFVYKITKY